MKRYLLRMLLLAALIVPWTTQAENVVIGDTTSTTTYYYMPVNMYFNYSMTQQIYTAQELGGLGGVINSISFKYAYSSSFSMTGVQLYMKNVTRTNFSSNTDYEAVTSADLVWTGTFAATGAGWVTITLPEPFVYDGTSNLLVCMYDPTSGYPGSSYKFTTSTTTGNMALDYYSDSYSPDLANLGSYSGSRYVRTYRNVVKIDLEPDGCSYPRNISLASNTANSATFNWNTSRTHMEQSYQYVVVPAGSDPDWTNFSTTTDTVGITVTGLAPNTPYDLYVRSNCGNEQSRPAKFSFRTQCAEMGSSDLPYACNFDDAPAGSANFDTHPDFMFCWNRILNPMTDPASRAYPYIYSDEAYAYSGNNSLMFQVSQTAPAVQVAILPQLATAVDPSTLRLSFFARCATAAAPSTLVIGVMFDREDITSFIPVDTVEITGTAYDRYFVSLAPYATHLQTAEGRYVTMRVYPTAADATTGGNLYIDDVKLELIPNCNEPGQLAVTGYEHNSVTLAWNSNGNETQWTIRYTEADTNLWQNVLATSNPFTVEGLDPFTSYVFNVAALCGQDTSGYSTPASATTLCDPITLADGDYGYDFNNDDFGSSSASDPNFIDCWLRASSAAEGIAPLQVTTMGRTGGSLYFDHYPAQAYYWPEDQIVLLPKITDDISRVRLTFYAYSFNGQGTLTIGVMSNQMDASTFVPVDTIVLEQASSYTRYIVDFDNYTGNGKFVAIAMIGSDQLPVPEGQVRVVSLVDDVTLHLRSTCPTPANLTLDEESLENVAVSWDAVEGADSYSVRIWQGVHFDIDSMENMVRHAPIVTINTTSLNAIFTDGMYYTDEDPDITEPIDFTINELSTYVVAVRANCANNEAGDWSLPVYANIPKDCGPGYAYKPANFDDGTEIESTYGLINTYYNNGYSQMLFTTDELSLDAGARISSLSFNFVGSYPQDRSLKVWLVPTNATELNSAFLTFDTSKVVKVYDDTFSFVQNADGWNIVEFDTVFEYDGMSNLLVIFGSHFSDYSDGANSFVLSNTPNRYRSAYNDSWGTSYVKFDETYGLWQGGTSASAAALNRPNIRFVKCNEIPGCYRVVDLVATPDSLVPTQVNLSWGINEEEPATPQFLIYYAPDTVTGDPSTDPGFTNVTNISPISETSYTVEGLEPNHNYRFYVQALCDVSLSRIVATDVVRTACAPFEWPLTAGFERTADEIAPDACDTIFGVYCWDRVADVNYPYVSSTAHTGSYALQWGAVADTNYALAVLPVMNEDEISLADAQLVFWGRANGANDTAYLYLYYATSANTITDATLFDSVMITGNTYKEYNYRISRANISLEGGERLALGAKKTLYIDDITLRLDPGALKPTTFYYVANSATQNQASFVWVDTDNQPRAPKYQLGFVEGDEWNADDEYMIIDEVLRTENDGDTIFYTTGSLEQNTRYVAAVRAVDIIDDEEVVSEWSTPSSVIVTKCEDIYDLPWTENFDDPDHVHRAVYDTVRTTRPAWATYGLTNSDVNCWAFGAPMTSTTGVPNNNIISYISNCRTYGRANGGNYMVMQTSSATNMAYAVLPHFDNAIEGLRLMFWYRNYSTNTSNKVLDLGYVTSVDDIAGTFVPVASFPVTATYEFIDYVFNQDTITIPDEGDVRLAFRSKQYPVMIDDIVVDEAPQCQYPVMFAAGATTAYTIPLSWVNSPIGTPNQWYIEYTHDTIVEIDTVYNEVDQLTILPGQIISADTVYNADSSEYTLDNIIADPDTIIYTLEGLEAYKTYSIRIKSDCGTEDDTTLRSDYTQPVVARTLNNATDIVSAALTSPAIQVDTAVFDRENHTIYITVNFGVDLSVFDAMKLALTASPNANGIFINGQRYSASTNYQIPASGLQILVKAEDTTISQTWTIMAARETCTYPRNIQFTNIERRSATASWTILDTLIYQYDYVLDTLTHSDAELEQLFTTIEGTTIDFTGLHREHTYNFYIRAHCSDGPNSLSKWIHATFQTNGLLVCSGPYGIGTGTYNSGYTFVNGGWGNSYAQTLFTAEELLASGVKPGPITAIELNHHVGSSGPHPKLFFLFMGDTTSTTLTSTTMVHQMTKVYSSGVSIVPTEGWHTYELQTPYVWDGVSNIVLGALVDEYDGGYTTYSYWYFTGTSATGKTVARYGDGTMIFDTINPSPTQNSATTYSYRPNVRFTSCSYSEACPAPDSLWIVKNPDNAHQVELHWHADGDYASQFEYVYSTDSTVDPDSTFTQSVYDANYVNLDNLDANTVYYVNLMTHCNGEGRNDGESEWRQLTFKTNSDCRIPENAAITLVDKLQVQLTFTMDSIQDHNYRYIVSDVELSDEELAAATPTATGITTDTVLVSLPNYGTTYYIYLGNDCGETWGVSPYTLVGTVLSADECPAPVNIEFSEIGLTGAVASWTRGQFGEENQWQIMWTNGTTTNNATVTDTFFVIPHLYPNTEYSVYVSAICGENSVSVPATANFITKPYTPCSQVGTGTTTATNSILNYIWGNSYGQTIYTAAELSAMGFSAGTIGTISLQHNVGSTAPKPKILVLFLGNTTATSLTTSTMIAASNMTRAYCSHTAITPTDGWHEYELQTPFVWDGTSNIVLGVLVDEPSSGGQSTSSNYWYFYSHSGSSVSRYADGVMQFDTINPSSNTSASGTSYNYRPNVKFCFNSDFEGCMPVSHLTVSNIETTTARADWYYGNDESAWQYVNVAGEAPSDSVLATLPVENVQTNSIDLTGLQPDVTYHLYVRPVCTDTTVRWVHATYTTKISCYGPTAITRHFTDSASRATNSFSAVAVHDDDSVTHNADLTTFEFQIWPWSNPQVGDTVSIIGGDSIYVDRNTDPRIRPNFWHGIRVRGICAEGDSSRWVSSSIYYRDTVQIPYIDNFQNSVYPTSLWSFANSGTSATYPSISSGYIRFYGGTSYGTEEWAVAPVVNVPLNQLQFVFNAWGGSAAGLGNHLLVGYMTADTQFVMIDTVNVASVSSTAPDLFEYYLEDLPDSAVAVAFKFAYTGATGYIYVDNVKLDYLPSCRKPDNFTIVDNTKAYSADLSWVASHGETSWLLRYQAAGDTVATDLVIDTTDCTAGANGRYTYVFGNLLPHTAYVANIYSLCGEDTSVVANNTVRFTTQYDTVTFATFGVAQPANRVVSTNIDRNTHTIYIDLLAGTERDSIVPSFTLFPAGSCVTYNGDTITSGSAAYDFNMEHVFTLHAPGTDVEPVEWYVYIDEEVCPTLTNLVLVDKGRSFADIEWHVGQSHNMTAPQTQFVISLATYGHTWYTDTITVNPDEEDVTLRRFRIEHLTRNTNYTVNLRSICKTDWAQSVSFKTNDMPCGDETQVIAIGEGTTGSTNALFYSGYGNSFGQIMFTAEELVAAGVNPGPITAVQLQHFIGTTAPNAKIMILYMGNTTATTMNSQSQMLSGSQMTKVYSSGTAILPTSGWHEYVFQTPFVWDGSSSVILAAVLDEPADGTNTGYTYWQLYSSSVSDRAYVRYADGNMIFDTINPLPTGGSYGVASTYRPNVKFTSCIPEAVCVAPENAQVQLTGEGTYTATVSWQRPDNENDSLYRAIVRRATDSVDYSTITTYDYEGAALSFDIDTLQPYTDYVVYLSSVCGGIDTAAATIWIEVPFRTNSICRVPNEFTAELTYKNQVTLNWVGDTAQGKNYSIVVSTEPIEDFDNIAEFDTTGLDTTTYVVDNLEYNTTYYFYIANVCDGAPSPFVEATATTTVECPAPVNLTASNLSTTSATLTWERGYMGDETQWEVTLLNDGDTVISFTTDTNRAIVTSLYDGTEYTALVRALCTGISEADTVDFMTPFFSACATVGTGTTNSTTTGLTTNYRNSTTEFIYTASEIGQGGSITSISFNVATAASGSYAGGTIEYKYYIGTTSLSSFTSTDWVPATNLTLVATRNTHYTAGVNTIEFDTPFDYNGTDNLVVVFTQQAQEWSGSPSVTYTTVTGSGIRQQNDSETQYADPAYAGTRSTVSTRPNLEVCFDAQPVDCGNPVTNIALDAVTETSASLSWYSGGRETQWQYFVYNVTDDTMAVDTAIANQANLTLATLQPNRDYIFNITPVCTNGTEAWTTFEFSTVYNCFAPVTAVATVNHELGIAGLKVTLDSTNTATQFEYQYRIAGAEEYTSVIAGDSTTLTDLTPFVNYEWRVRSVCSETDNSLWTAGNNFLYRGIIELPYVEGFEETAGLWNYWTSERIAGTGTAGYSRNSTATYVHAGSYSYKLADQSSGTVTTWTSPRINVPTANAYMFSIWVYRSHYSTLKPNEGIRFWTSTDETLDSTDTELMYIHRQYTVEPVVSSTGWYKYSAVIPAAGIQRVIFEGISEYGQATYFDDIDIHEITDSDYATLVLLSDSLGTLHGDTTVFIGSRVTISATPIEHYQFIMWSDSNTANPRTITLMHNDTLSAVFGPATYTVATTTLDGWGYVNGTGNYTYLDTVTLEAIGSAGFEFYFWNGDSTQTTNPLTFIVTGDTTLGVTFGGVRYAVNGVANIEGVEFIGAGRYYYGDTVSITAPEVHGFTFMGWNDDPEDTLGVTRTFVLGAADTTFYATYDTAEFVLTLNVNDAELGTVTGAGTYKYMREVTITAIPNEGNFFSQWSDGVTTATRTVTVDGDITLTAIFSHVVTYQVAVNVADTNIGTVTGSGIYNTGTQVTVTATAKYGYIFSQWSNGVTDPTYTFTLTQDTVLTAQFVFDTFNVIVHSGNSVMGTVSENVRVNYTGTTTIAAYPNYGYHFTMWNDSVTANPRTVTVTDNVEYTAYFGVNMYTIAATAVHGTVTGQGQFPYDTVIQLEAIADEGYVFVGWADDSTIQSAIRLVRVDTNRTFTALFTPVPRTVHIAVADTNRGTVNFTDSIVANGTTILVKATPKYGYDFDMWSDSVMTAQRNLNVTSDTILVAYFKPHKFHMTVTSNSSAYGTLAGTGDYDYLSNVEISATPRTGYDFVMWSDSVLTAQRTVQIKSDTVFTAIFAAHNYAVHVQVNNPAFGSVDITDTTIAHNQRITITATPATGYHLANWSDDTTVTSNIRTLVINKDTTIVANFAINEYRLTLTSNIDTTLAVSSFSGAGTYEHGQTATIQVTPNAGYSFLYWRNVTTGDTTSANPYSFTMTANTTYRAFLMRDSATITVVVNDTAMGRAYINGITSLTSYRTLSGSDVLLTAVNNNGYHFVNWSDGDTNAIRSYNVSGNVTLMANFEADAPTTATVSLYANDANMGAVIGAGTFDLGTTVTIIARPIDHHHFVNWNDGNTDTVRSFVLTQDTAFTATFAIDRHTITVLAEDTTMGVTQGTGEYNFGEFINISATGKPGYHFVRWTDNSTDSIRTIRVEGDATYTAVFEQNVGIDDVEEGLNVEVYSAEGQIFVRGAEQHMVYVYDAVGRLVVSQKATVETVIIPMKATGVYVVKVDGAAARRVAVVR